jgi:hypothetical protein
LHLPLAHRENVPVIPQETRMAVMSGTTGMDWEIATPMH